MPRTRSLALALVLFPAFAACGGSGDSPAVTDDAGMVSTASSGAEPTADEISNYELTMDRMRRWMTATRNLATAAERNPSLREMPDAGEVSMAELVAWYERTPAARDALRSAGIGPRDYVLTMLAYMQAAMTEAVLTQYKDAQAPAGQSLRNVEFVRANRAALEQLQRELGLDRVSRDFDDDDDDDG